MAVTREDEAADLASSKAPRVIGGTRGRGTLIVLMTSRRVRAKNEFDGIAPFDDPLAVPVPERSSGKVTGDGFL